MDPRDELVDLLTAAWLRDAGDELQRLGVTPEAARGMVAARVPQEGVEVRSYPEGIALRTTCRPPRRSG